MIAGIKRYWKIIYETRVSRKEEISLIFVGFFAFIVTQIIIGSSAWWTGAIAIPAAFAAMCILFRLNHPEVFVTSLIIPPKTEVKP